MNSAQWESYLGIDLGIIPNFRNSLYYFKYYKSLIEDCARLLFEISQMVSLLLVSLHRLVMENLQLI